MKTIDLTASEHAKHLVAIANLALSDVIVSQLEPHRRLLFVNACNAMEALAIGLKDADDEATARWVMENAFIELDATSPA